jgi:hypothetical protein
LFHCFAALTLGVAAPLLTAALGRHHFFWPPPLLAAALGYRLSPGHRHLLVTNATNPDADATALQARREAIIKEDERR